MLEGQLDELSHCSILSYSAPSLSVTTAAHQKLALLTAPEAIDDGQAPASAKSHFFLECTLAHRRNTNNQLHSPASSFFPPIEKFSRRNVVSWPGFSGAMGRTPALLLCCRTCCS